MLLKKEGKTLIQHTWESVKSFETIIATDSEEIASVCRKFGANVIKTPKCSCGTERILQATEKMNFDYLVNLQGDCPDFGDENIKKLIKLNAGISTAYYKDKDGDNPSKVKLVVAQKNKVLYFSRLPIPYQSDYYNIHIGTYVFSKKAAKAIKGLYKNTTPNHLYSENLEQLKWMNHGMEIKAVRTEKCLSIDTWADYELFLEH